MDSTFYVNLPNRFFCQPLCRLQNLDTMIMFRTSIKTKTEQTTVITGITQEVIKEFTLDCFLHSKIKLRRNWGRTDLHNQLDFKNTTLLQFDSRTANFQIFIQPVGKQACTVTLTHHTKQSKPLFDYFLNKLKTLTRS